MLSLPGDSIIVNGVALYIQYSVGGMAGWDGRADRMLMGIYVPAEGMKKEYLETREEPSLIHAELKHPAARNSQ